ncbi:27S pre-rRNA (guanosine(2922)-2'-O)-methyltransferase [Gracilariopsis chorda]|uniref:27S pre-rRNA (Guanosine(2922)-2'-O)-methyltransferase n=1 Tax=Gracilariopsis chorda TaxID=448386 RepID=A0A2V3IUK1_9FLOR|nr:27S pre-rRNA (guanosine(2922)-2'-O)-methyltransferase [Gracilariopsis chorda]|eukprot:PXF45397.1 27S pre-rRNA (guanosine(2922)-2'-O)-methyltransferase [Gracilariopsis chorda]
MNQLFNRVNATKPSASRAESAEIYVMCINYKAPKSIDPRLLSPKYVFKDLGTAKDSLADKQDLFLNTVMREMKRRKRHRGGYEDGENILFRRVSILQFCQSPRPVAMMVQSSQFSFDTRDIENISVSREDALRIARTLESMAQTTSEVLSCCEDLKVLARREFKLLLRWRSAARDMLQKEGILFPGKEDNEVEEQEPDDREKGSEGQNSEENQESEEEDSEEEELKEEMNKAMAEQMAKEKRKKRKASKLRNAIQRKIDMKIILPDQGTGYQDSSPVGLFSLNVANRALKHGANVTDIPVDNSNTVLDNDDGYDGDGEVTKHEPVVPYKAGDINAPWKDDTKEIEKELDRWYKLYLSERKRDKNGVLLQESRERRRMTKRQKIREDTKEEKSDIEKGEDKKADLEVDSSESSSEEDPTDDEHHIPKQKSTSREASLWFSQPVFQDIPGLYSSDSEDEHDHAPLSRKKQRHGEEDLADAMDESNIEDDAQENFSRAAKAEARSIAAKSEKRKNEDEAFEVVPMESEKLSTKPKRGKGDEEEDLSDSSFHSSDYDTDEKAEMVAIGKRMRQSKNEANDVLDEAYNRYTFDDPASLPRWFADPDPTYRQRQPPVTKEQVLEMKEYIKSLQAMPTKKEREAKARKRARIAKKMEAMKAKANSIAEQADIPASSRMRAIEELYKKAMKSDKNSKKGKGKQYQVVKPTGRITVGKNISKGRKGAKGARTVLVDKRMKADKRGLAKAQKKKGKSKK